MQNGRQSLDKGQESRYKIMEKKTGQTLGKKTKPETKYGSEKKVKSKIKKNKKAKDKKK